MPELEPPKTVADLYRLLASLDPDRLAEQKIFSPLELVSGLITLSLSEKDLLLTTTLSSLIPAYARSESPDKFAEENPHANETDITQLLNAIVHQSGKDFIQILYQFREEYPTQRQEDATEQDVDQWLEINKNPLNLDQSFITSEQLNKLFNTISYAQVYIVDFLKKNTLFEIDSRNLNVDELEVISRFRKNTHFYDMDVAKAILMSAISSKFKTLIKLSMLRSTEKLVYRYKGKPKEYYPLEDGRHKKTLDHAKFKNIRNEKTKSLIKKPAETAEDEQYQFIEEWLNLGKEIYIRSGHEYVTVEAIFQFYKIPEKVDFDIHPQIEQALQALHIKDKLKTEADLGISKKVTKYGLLSHSDAKRLVIYLIKTKNFNKDSFETKNRTIENNLELLRKTQLVDSAENWFLNRRNLIWEKNELYVNWRQLQSIIRGDHREKQKLFEREALEWHEKHPSGPRVIIDSGNGLGTTKIPLGMAISLIKKVPLSKDRLIYLSIVE